MKRLPYLMLLLSETAVAGMPSVTLTDLAGFRLSSISFFIVAFLVATWVFKWAWNYLGKTFVGMPPLKFKQALGFMLLWGLLFNLVLVMISGARELMTPGAWKKAGVTYQLKDDK